MCEDNSLLFAVIRSEEQLQRPLCSLRLNAWEEVAPTPRFFLFLNLSLHLRLCLSAVSTFPVAASVGEFLMFWWMSDGEGKCKHSMVAYQLPTFTWSNATRPHKLHSGKPQLYTEKCPLLPTECISRMLNWRHKIHCWKLHLLKQHCIFWSFLSNKSQNC